MDQQNSKGKKISKTLADFAYQAIRNDIIRGELKADEKLRLSNLCKKYDIGMSPLREALARLIGDTLVVTEGQRGFWVAPLSIDELVDISSVRNLLEGEALQRSMEHGGDEWRARLTLAFEELTQAEEALGGRSRNVVPEWEQANRHFHEVLVSQCGSPWLQRILKTLYQQAERYRRISLVNTQTNRTVHDEHEAIYEAVMQGNVLKACRLVELHLRLTDDVVRNFMQANVAE